MKYRIHITDETLEQVKSYLDYVGIEMEAPLSAERWWDRAIESLQSLEKMPFRFAKAPEDALRDYEVRMMIVKPGVFLYNVDKPNHMVRILAFYHGSQQQGVDQLPAEL